MTDCLSQSSPFSFALAVQVLRLPLLFLMLCVQAYAEHHGSHNVKAGRVDSQPPGQMEDAEQPVDESLAEDPIRVGGCCAHQSDSQARQNWRHLEALSVPPTSPPSLPLCLPRPPLLATGLCSVSSGSEGRDGGDSSH